MRDGEGLRIRTAPREGGVPWKCELCERDGTEENPIVEIVAPSERSRELEVALELCLDCIDEVAVDTRAWRDKTSVRRVLRPTTEAIRTAIRESRGDAYPRIAKAITILSEVGASSVRLSRLAALPAERFLELAPEVTRPRAGTVRISIEFSEEIARAALEGDPKALEVLQALAASACELGFSAEGEKP